MNAHAITTIARQELVINIRNRWTLVFAGVFGLLALAISYFGLLTAGATGSQGFSRTSASLVNLVLYMVPLVALVMGTLSFTSEKSFSELLFSQPIARADILVGKLAGLFVSIFTATLIGFGLAGVVIAATAGTAGAWRYPVLVILSLFLALIFLSLSAFISALCERNSRAYGVALFVWFFFVFFYDLLVMGVTFFLGERTANVFIFGSLFGNPVDLVRVGSLMTLNGREIFGAGGAALLRFLGGELRSIVILLTMLGVWVIAPLFFAHRLLQRQDI
ncbi:MAG TPA: ABC transporter permease subunit [Pyrinomonadaceae bacterium]|nr:ABC transporter permease subunit [Pyrinomonadaceae bacterium]